ncbi:MAG: glycine dehydrogenase subunit 2 [Gemmatimonadetes bacterium]|nr:MAG: glycine dehydrogenase subunit 2 [Gemmatimonadota bacterium]
MYLENTIFEMSRPGRKGYSLPPLDVPVQSLTDVLPLEQQRQSDYRFPEVSEGEVVRHFVRLSTLNYHIDKGFYPLGSCTMKYNPKVNEDMSRLDGFSGIHPFQDECTAQGALQLMYELSELLAEISGMDAVTLEPAAGAQGEYTGLMMMRAYHRDRGRSPSKIIVPDAAHGTNPASAALAGFKTVEVRSTEAGEVDLEMLRRLVDSDTAGIMLTNPNTLGIFESQITEMSRMLHEVDALLYMDGANLNALLGITRPGDMGFDVVHFNLHKTFTTPHGGGGPGSGPVGVRKELIPYLPTPTVAKKEDGSFAFDYDRPKSIGKVHSFYGNFGMFVRAYTYIRMMGPKGLRNVSETAILNANYLMKKLEPYFDVPFPRHCQHEFVLSADRQAKQGVRALDIAKALLDKGYHAPTIYFPLIVHECLMIEPTETTTKETLDTFADALIQIAKMAATEPEVVRQAPQHTPVTRLDEATAARKPILKYQFES